MKKDKINLQESDADKHKRLKKRIIIIIASLLVFVVLYFLVIQNIDIDGVLTKLGFGDESDAKPTIIFYPADYDENIFNDEAYMDKDRNIYYNDGTLTISITENGNFDYSEYAPPVEFLGDMIDLIIAGDHEQYNECFSQLYYSAQNSKTEDDFTMQKLYNIKIIKCSETAVSNGGNNYNEYVYALEYMIFKNNGTFRTDIGSDANRTQYITMTDRTGSILIDSVTYVSYK